MLINTFYEGDDYEQYPENEYLRSKKIYNMFGLTRIYPNMIYAYPSRWSWDAKKLYLSSLLLYNEGVFISFKDHRYSFDLPTEELVSISRTNEGPSFLKFYLYIDKHDVTLNNIILRFDNVDYSIDITKAVISSANNAHISRFDDSVYVSSRASSEIYLQIKINLSEYKIPRYKDFRLVNNFTDYDNSQVMLYDTENTFLVYDKVIQEFYEYKYTVRRKNDILQNSKPFSYYLDKNLSIDNKVLSLYFKPLYYEDDDGIGFVAVRALELHIVPVEQAYVDFTNARYHGLISIGTLQKLNSKTNHYRLFKNGIKWPAFTECTLYKICSPAATISNGPNDVPTDVYNYMMYPYPYQILLLMYDYMFLTNHLDVTNIQDGYIVDYISFNLDDIIYKQDFSIKNHDIIDTVNTKRTKILTFNVDGIVLYNNQKIPVSKINTNIDININNKSKTSVSLTDNTELTDTLTKT